MRITEYCAELDGRQLLITPATDVDMGIGEDYFFNDYNDCFYDFVDGLSGPIPKRHMTIIPRNVTWDELADLIVLDEDFELNGDFGANLRECIKGDGSCGYWLVGCEVYFDFISLHYANESGDSEWVQFNLRTNKKVCLHIELSQNSLGFTPKYHISNESVDPSREIADPQYGIKIDEHLGYQRKIMLFGREPDRKDYLLVSEFAGI